MQFKKNAAVFTLDGKKLGEIDRVVLNPHTREATHIVVRKGFIFTQDKVVPVEFIKEAGEDRVILNKIEENTEEFYDFKDIEYVPFEPRRDGENEPTYYAPPFIGYNPYPGTAWPGFPGYSVPPYMRKMQVNIPEGTIALEEGARVRSRDGGDAGEVERVYTEPTENRVTHIVTVKGVISRERRLIPSSWIDNVAEDEITLAVDLELIESLPAYSG